MKYKTKIISRGSKYIGELLENGQVVYTTEELNDPVIVSRALASYIARITPRPVALPVPPSSVATQVPVANTVTRNFLAAERTPFRKNAPAPTGKCCGRG